MQAYKNALAYAQELDYEYLRLSSQIEFLSDNELDRLNKVESLDLGIYYSCVSYINNIQKDTTQELIEQNPKGIVKATDIDPPWIEGWLEKLIEDSCNAYYAKWLINARMIMGDKASFQVTSI